MKKLLVLGGSRYAIPVIKAAHDLGAYVVTADYLPGNIAHKYSDEYCNVNIVDKEAVLACAEKMNIDGISSFACDPGVITAAYVAERLGLPSCGSYESVCILQNKGRFREFLSRNGFVVPHAKKYDSLDKAMGDTGYFNWPVIVKPTDSAGSKGVSRVDNEDDLRRAIENALKFSRSKEYIIEDFIQQKGFSSDSDSFSVDGEFKFISFNSQRFDTKADNPYTPAAYNWPSSISEEHQEELKKELQRLISLLNMRTSIYNIETREGIDGKAYIMECSPRGGGNRLAECLEYATGIKLVENSVRAALGMEINNVEQRSYDGYWAEVILHSDKDGVYNDLWLNDDIKGYIVEKDIWIKPGVSVNSFSAANMAIGTMIMKFDDKHHMESVMDNIEELVKVDIL